MSIPEPRYFLVDNAQLTGAMLAALAGYDAQYFSFTPALGLQDTTVAGVKLLKTFATEAEIDADPDLGDFRAASRPNSVCQGCFQKLSQLRAFGFHMLGESARSTRGRGATSIVWIDDQDNGGAGDGSTPWSAYANFRDYKENGNTTWQLDTVYAIMGCQAGDRTDEAGSNGFPKNTDPVFQDATGAPIFHCMDYLDRPGFLFIGHRDVRGTRNQFTRPDAANFPRLWTCADLFDGTILLPIDPTLSTTDIYANHVFKSVSSQTEVEAEAMTRWYDSGNATLYVHMPDDANPTNRIGSEGHLGWAYAHSYMQPTTAYGGLEFINCQVMAGTNTSAAMTLDENDKLDVNPHFPVAQFLGGRYLMGASFKMQGDVVDGTIWGYSSDGDVVFDTSDRPDPANDNAIQEIVTQHGSNIAEWNKMLRYLQIDSAGEGIYQFQGGVYDDPGIRADINGLLIGYSGTAHPTLLAKKGFTPADGSSLYDDRDGHPLGWQGVSRWWCRYVYAHHGGGGVVNYLNDDAASTQNCIDNKYEDIIVRDSHQKFAQSTGGAGQFGIYIGQDGQGPRTDGSGIKTGTIIRRFYIGNIVGDATQAFGTPPGITDGVALPTGQFEQGATIEDGTIEACTNAHIGGDVTTDTTYVDYPLHLGEQPTISRLRYIQIEQYVFWHRAGNFASDLSYIISNNNYIQLKSSESTVTAVKWRGPSIGEDVFSAWQGQSKGDSVAPQVSVFDPDSTIEVAT